MHYIVGTRFSVITLRRKFPGQIIPQTERIPTHLPEGMSYVITHITKVDSDMAYTFTSDDRKIHVVNFKSCRDADSYISKCRGEIIPAYSSDRELQ